MRKYGMPRFCLGKKAICYLWTDKKTHEPYILLVDGNQIDHPKLQTGDRKRMKIYRVNPSKDIEVDEIVEILKEAVEVAK